MTRRIFIVACVMALTLCVTRAALAEPAAHARWDHVHLTAPDTKVAAEWYSAQFGGEITTQGDFHVIAYGDALVKFKKGEAGFEPSAGSSVDHIGFSVPDVPAKIASLKAAGAKVVSEPRYAKQGDFTYAFIEDPWGVKIEIIDDKEIRGFHHVHLMSGDRDATIKWYAATFGGELSHFKGIAALPGIRYGDMWLVASSSRREVAPIDGRAIDHLGWKVTNMEEFAKRAKAAGVKFLVEPRRMGSGIHFAFVEGPDGVKIEVQQKPE